MFSFPPFLINLFQLLILQQIYFDFNYIFTSQIIKFFFQFFFKAWRNLWRTLSWRNFKNFISPLLTTLKVNYSKRFLLTFFRGKLRSRKFQYFLCSNLSIQHLAGFRGRFVSWLPWLLFKAKYFDKISGWKFKFNACVLFTIEKRKILNRMI